MIALQTMSDFAARTTIRSSEPYFLVTRLNRRSRCTWLRDLGAANGTSPLLKQRGAPVGCGRRGRAFIHTSRRRLEMTVTISQITSEEQWQTLRKPNIGASEIGALFGSHHYCT